jgi:hypothetical protein
MALNPFFLQGSAAEQRLVQDLINEQLRMYGVEVVYVPRFFVNKKTIIEEVQTSKFDDSYLLEAYVNNYEGYTGAGDILTKFGMSLKDELNLVISRERFEEFISPFLQEEDAYEVEVALRPREGDVIYFPLGQRLFEVKFVEHEKPFYQLGKGYVYELSCELFEYENEVFDTGNEDVDAVIANQGEILSLRLVGYGQTAVLGADINSNYVRKIYLNNDGYGYTSTPTVTFSNAPAFGRTAQAVAITTSVAGVRSIKEIVLKDAGWGYTSIPTITISGGGGTGAAATCSIDVYRKGVSFVPVTSGGQGYTTSPSVTFSGPTFIGAAGTAVIADTALDRVVINNGGSSYSPKLSIGVTFSPPNPIGFVTAIATANIQNEQLSSFNIANIGIGYSQAPTITIDSPTGVGSTATVIAVGGLVYGETVSSISIASSGQFYITNPTLTFDNPTGIASTARVSSSLVSSGGISTISYSLLSSGRYYTTEPSLNIDFLVLSPGFVNQPKFGSNSWKIISTEPNRNITRPAISGAGVVSIGITGSIQMFVKVPSTLSGVSTFIELNRLSNGGYANNVDMRVNSSGYFEVGIGTISLTSNVYALDDTWHYLYLSSDYDPPPVQTVTLTVDGTDTSGYSFPTVTVIELVTNADITPPVIKNSTNSGILLDDIFGTKVSTGTSAVPTSTPVPNSNTVLFDDFENSIGTLNSISIGCSISNGRVISLDNNSTTLSGIVTSIVSAAIEAPTGTPSDFRATGIASVTSGVLTSVTLTYGGYGYLTNPNVTVSGPTGVGSNFRATAIANLRSSGRLNQILITNPGLGYTATPSVTISGPLGQIPEGYGVVGVSGTITSVVITKPGIGYTVAPTVSIANTVTDRDFTAGFTTARGRAVLNSVTNEIDYILIDDPGSGYQSPPTVTIGSPPVIIGVGTYWFNEVVTGSISSTTARVKRWDADDRIIQISIENGKFVPGELLVGAASSAIYVVDEYLTLSEVPAAASLRNLDDYEENDEIEFEADQIIDFSESNPFGNY